MRCEGCTVRPNADQKVEHHQAAFAQHGARKEWSRAAMTGNCPRLNSAFAFPIFFPASLRGLLDLGNQEGTTIKRFAIYELSLCPRVPHRNKVLLLWM